MTPQQIMNDKDVLMDMLKKAYEAGQESVYCGCYEIENCTSFNEWVFNILTSNTDDATNK